MRISCLAPTYNRPGIRPRLLDETVESFLRQDYPDKELILLNDTPGQKLILHDAPGVVIINHPDRFPTLSDKIELMINEASGKYLCRWDDDDICLPHRLSYSMKALQSYMGSSCLEWRSTNYWYCPAHKNGAMHYINGAGNTHCMGLWDRAILDKLEPKGYPPKMSGGEDQEFNRLADLSGFAAPPCEIPAEEIFYLYRWGVSQAHLSATSGDPVKIQRYYDEIGRARITEGTHTIRPQWYANYTLLAERAALKHDSHAPAV